MDSTTLQHQPDLLRVLEPLVATIDPPPHGRITVVDASQSGETEISRWATIFQRMNELRNTIVDRAGGELLLCLPPWLYETFATFAPDFWSIRSDEFLLPDPPAPLLPWWHHPVFGRTIHRIMALADGFLLEEIPSGSELTALADRLRGTSRLVRLGEKLLDLGRYEESAAVLDLFRQTNSPDFPINCITKAESFLQMGNQHKAALAFEVAMSQISPLSSTVYTHPICFDFIMLAAQHFATFPSVEGTLLAQDLELQADLIRDQPSFAGIRLGIAASFLMNALLLHHQGSLLVHGHIEAAITVLSFPAAQAPDARLLPHRAALLALALLHKACFRLAAHDAPAALATLGDAAPWITDLAGIPAVADVHATLRDAERELWGEARMAPRPAAEGADRAPT